MMTSDRNPESKAHEVLQKPLHEILSDRADEFTRTSELLETEGMTTESEMLSAASRLLQSLAETQNIERLLVDCVSGIHIDPDERIALPGIFVTKTSLVLTYRNFIGLSRW